MIAYSIGYLLGPLVCGLLAYLVARTFAEQHGRTPWSLPALVWGLIGALTVIFGLLLLVIARRTTSTSTATPATSRRVEPQQDGAVTGPVLSPNVLPRF